jgi:hypothetical protein
MNPRKKPDDRRPKTSRLASVTSTVVKMPATIGLKEREDARDTNAKEGMNEEDELLRKVIPLKEPGKEIAAGLGLAELETLRSLLVKHPDHFQTLLAIAQGQEPNDPAGITFLIHCAFLKKDGSINQCTRDVLISAYQNPSGEGPVLVNPFKLDNQQQAEMLERLIAGNSRRLLEWFRDGDNDLTPP